MTLRRPTLDEWFNAYQHRKMWREHSYMVGGLTVDVTPVVRDWEARDELPNYPAILSRAAALAVRAHPGVNRAYLKTIRGDRMIEFDGIHINLPIRFKSDNGPVLTAVVLRDADRRSSLDLKEEIRGHVLSGLKGTQVTKLVATKPNTWYWRLVLRVLWFVAWRVPMVERYGGAVGVSCPASGSRMGRAAVFCGPTPTSILIALSGIRREDGRVLLDIGVMADHLAVDGVTLREFLQTLGDLLEGVNDEGVAVLR